MSDILGEGTNRANMNCTEVEELAGAFALGAVPANESEALVAHLAECSSAHQLVGELIEVASLLPFVCKEAEPPARLRGNVLAVALADALPPSRDGVMATTTSRATQPLVPPSIAPSGATGEPIPFRAARSPRRPWMNPAIWAAAAVLLIAIGLGAWNVGLRRDLNSRSAAEQQRQQVLAAVAGGAHVVQMIGQNGIQATLVQSRDGGAAYIIGSMPALPAGKTYEAWVIRNGQPVPAGLFRPSGFAVMTLRRQVAGAQAVAFTVEREQGSDQPTLPLIAQAPVS